MTPFSIVLIVIALIGVIATSMKAHWESYQSGIALRVHGDLQAAVHHTALAARARDLRGGCLFALLLGVVLLIGGLL